MKSNTSNNKTKVSKELLEKRALLPRDSNINRQVMNKMWTDIRGKLLT